MRVHVGWEGGKPEFIGTIENTGSDNTGSKRLEFRLNKLKITNKSNLFEPVLSIVPIKSPAIFNGPSWNGDTDGSKL